MAGYNILIKKRMPTSIYDIAISFIHALGPKGTAHLVECFGSAEAVYAATAEELLLRAELNDRIARMIVAKEGMREAEREADYCRRNGIVPVGLSDEAQNFRMTVFSENYNLSLCFIVLVLLFL